MSNTTIAKPSPRIPAVYDPSQFRVTENDLEIFSAQLASLFPNDVFDAHGHW